MTYVTRLAGRLSLAHRAQFMTDLSAMTQAAKEYHARFQSTVSKNDVALLTARLYQEYAVKNDLGQALCSVLVFCRQSGI